MKKIFTYIYIFFLTGIFMINAYASEITMPTSPVKDIIGYYDANRYNSYIYQVPVGTTVYSICDGTVTLAKRQPGFWKLYYYSKRKRNIFYILSFKGHIC